MIYKWSDVNSDGSGVNFDGRVNAQVTPFILNMCPPKTKLKEGESNKKISSKSRKLLKKHEGNYDQRQLLQYTIQTNPEVERDEYKWIKLIRNL